MLSASSSLSKTIALVTGGCSGLGAAAAKCLVRHGARVVVADLEHQKETFLRVKEELMSRSPPPPSSSRQQQQQDGGNNNAEQQYAENNLTFAAADVTDSDQVAAALDHAEHAYGRPVSAAINCAGIAKLIPTLMLDKDDDTNTGRVVEPHPLDDFVHILNVNTVGTFNVSRLAAQRMVQQLEPDEDGLRGCIIHTASVAAYDAQMTTAAYAASKGAVVGMTLPMARDLASSGIRVMSIAPGPFDTPMLDVVPEEVKEEIERSWIPCPSRLGRPDEFGHLVVSILTNPMLNGSVIRLDGAVRLPHVNA